MSTIPADRRYASSHEWAMKLEGDIIAIGISDHAQAQLGDLVYVEIPEISQDIEAGGACAVVESVKAASDVYCPVGGTVVEINDALNDAPELVNQDPYGEGWLFRLQSSDEIS